MQFQSLRLEIFHDAAAIGGIGNQQIVANVQRDAVTRTAPAQNVGVLRLEMAEGALKRALVLDGERATPPDLGVRGTGENYREQNEGDNRAKHRGDFTVVG